MPRFKLLSFVFLFFCSTCPLTLYADQNTVGYLEKVTVGEQGFTIAAKIDTGADNSSINTVDPVNYEKDGKTWVKFKVVNKDGDTLNIDTPIVKYTSVKTKTGGRQRRMVITLDICLNGIRKHAQVNLVDRSHFKYQLLIGRSFLRPEFLVDSGKSYIATASCQ